MKKNILFVALVACMSAFSVANGQTNVVKNVKTEAKTEVKPAVSGKQPDIKFSKMEHDFGNIPQGTPVTTEFEVTNTGKAPLIISNVNVTCGCTTPFFTKDPIMPGKKGLIKATFNAAAAGAFTKGITVVTNVPDKAGVPLIIKGTVTAVAVAPAIPNK